MAGIARVAASFGGLGARCAFGAMGRAARTSPATIFSILAPRSAPVAAFCAPEPARALALVWVPFAKAGEAEVPTIMELMNRNKRRPTKANHGARPCSSFARRARRPRGTNTGKRRGN